MARKRSTPVERNHDAAVTSTAQPHATTWPQDDSDLRQRVEQKAYELYQRRGGEPGHELEDWLEAERLIRDESGTTSSRR